MLATDAGYGVQTTQTPDTGPVSAGAMAAVIITGCRFP
jgi:hypothetical protein